MMRHIGLFLSLQIGWTLALSAHKAVIGKDVDVPCSFTVSRAHLSDVRRDLSIIWYFQGQKILSVKNANVEPSDPRMSYRVRAEDGKADLSISNVTILDGGIYKCVTSYRSQEEEKEIRLDVQALPQITITDKVVVLNRDSVLHSVISGFYPVDIAVTWLRDGVVLDNIIMEKPQRDPEGTYSVRSSVTITPTEEDRGRNFSCRVQHESLTAPLQEDFQLVYGDIPSVHITSQAFKLNIQQSMVCSVSGFYPEPITVNWFLNDTLVENTNTRRISSSAVESDYSFIPTEQNWGMELTCVVDHGTLIRPHVERLLVQGRDLKRRYRPLIIAAIVVMLSIFAATAIVLLLIKQRKKRLPKVRMITRTSGGAFSLNVDHFTPKDIEVVWEVIQPPSSRNPKRLNSTINVDQNSDRTFYASSMCESLRGLIQGDEEYVVQAVVTHSKLKEPKHREWRSSDRDNKEFLAKPEVEMIQFQKLFVNKPTQLQCRVSQFYPNELTVNWFMRKSGRLIDIADGGRYKILNSSFQLQSNKTFTCTLLLEVTPSLEDQGSEIICRVDHPSLEEPIESTTGDLPVLVKPELEQPIKLSVVDSGDAMGCLTLLSFFPYDINVTWTFMLGQNQEKVKSEEKVTKNRDGTFKLDSQCKIPGQLLQNPECTLKVTWNHESMETPESREISMKDSDFPWRPRIENITPLILQVNQKTTVSCTISGYFPENIRVTWLEKRGNVISDCIHKSYMYRISDITHMRLSDNTYHCSPSLSFTPTSDKGDLEFICRVDHPSLEHPIELSTGPPIIHVPPQEPRDANFTLLGPDKVLCSLTLPKFYPQNIKITWECKENYHTKPLPSTKKIIQTNDEKLFDAISECVVPWRSSKSLVHVTWEHESTKKAGSRDLRITDLPWRPVIEETCRSPLVEHKMSRLQYTISHYYPNELTVTWYKKEKYGALRVLHRNQETSAAQMQPDYTYSCTTSLCITPSLLSDQGSEFICKVEHPSLEKPIERSSGPIEVCVPPSVQDPIPWSLTNRREAVLSLRLQRFYPKSMEIEWSCSCGQSLKPDNDYKNNADTTFNVTSQCVVTPAHMMHPVYPTIRVTWKHVTMTDPESREVSIKDKGFPWRPEVTEIYNPVLLSGRNVTVQCDIRNFFPENLLVTWSVKERGSPKYEQVDVKTGYQTKMTPHSSNSGFSCTYSVEFIPSISSHHGVMFMCNVKHPSLKDPIERSTQPLFISYPPTLKDSVKLTPCGFDEVLCSVRLEKVFPKNINFTWTFGGKEVSECKPKKVVEVEEEERFSVVSECRIPWKRLQFPVRVSWEQETMQKPQSTEFTGPDFPWRPRIETPDTTYLILNTESKIQCRISGYFPSDLTVTWFKKEEKKSQLVPVTSDAKYKTPILMHQKQPDNTYSCTACLTFTPSQGDQGSEFVCKVEHPKLKQPIEERIRPLQMMGLLWCPRIDDLQTSNMMFGGEQKIKIECRISGYSPATLTVTWLKKSKGKEDFVALYNSDKYDIADIKHQMQANKTYSCTATLLFKPNNDGSEVMCRVGHPSLEQPIEKRTGPLQFKKKA